jgi:hypothetical protein
VALPARAVRGVEVWAQRRRWRSNGVWARAMSASGRSSASSTIVSRSRPWSWSMPRRRRAAATARRSMRPAAEAAGRSARSARVGRDPRRAARRSRGLRSTPDVVAARELLRDRLDDSRAWRRSSAICVLGPCAARRGKHLALDIKAPPPSVSGFVPIRPLYRISSTPSASSGAGGGCRAAMRAPLRAPRAWLELASVGDFAWRVVA